ncbi:unnamed protein product [Dibothriocephalus latus]|uniref:Uncharacterized protein n=1 Tax=Dibothriocephalus latus TaxID=60516 RepID=A0A3P7P517_DIBLA|nr:unnamed protein product [Dibothriocephalus latus]
MFRDLRICAKSAYEARKAKGIANQLFTNGHCSAFSLTLLPGIGLGMQASVTSADSLFGPPRWMNEKQKSAKEQKSLADLMTANQLRFSKAFSGGPILPPVPRHSAEENAARSANGDSVVDSARAVIVTEATLKKTASASTASSKAKATPKRKVGTLQLRH